MPDKQEARRELRKKAQEAATGAGRKWAELSKEERKPFLKMARGAAKKDTVRVNRMAGAKEAAEKAGKTWSALSKKERQSFRKEAS